MFFHINLATFTDAITEIYTMKTTRAVQANSLEMGRLGTAKSFCSVFKHDPQVATYLGYTDLAEFRNFSSLIIALTTTLRGVFT